MAENDNLRGNETEQNTELTSNNEMMEDTALTQNDDLAEKNNLPEDNVIQEETESFTINAAPNDNPVKKKFNSKMAAFIAAAVIVIGAAGVLFAKLAVPVLMPKVYIAGAMASTQKELLSETKKVQELMGIDLQKEIMQSEARQKNLTFSIKDMTGEGADKAAGVLRGMGLSAEAKRNKEGTLVTGKIALNQNSLSLIEANFSKKDSEVGFSIPKLFNQYLVVNLDTFVKDYNESALGKMIGKPLEEEKYNTIRHYLENSLDQKHDNELAKKIGQRAKQLSEKIDVKYIGKTSIKVAGEDKRFSSYEMNVPEAEIKSYSKDVVKLLMEDKNFQDYLKTLDAMEDANSQQKTSDTMKKAVSEFNSGIDKAENFSLKVNLVIDNKAHIIKQVYQFGGKIDGKNTEIQIEASLLGSRFMLDDTQFAMTMKSDGEKAGVNFASASNYGNGDNKIKHNMTVKTTVNDADTTNMKIDMNYDMKAKENNLLIKADVSSPDNTSLTMDLKGTMMLDNAKKQVDIAMDNVAFNLSESEIESGIIFTGKYNIKAIKTSDIQMKQNNVKQLFSMNEEEINQLIQGIYTGIIQVGSALYQ